MKKDQFGEMNNKRNKGIQQETNKTMKTKWGRNEKVTFKTNASKPNQPIY